MTVPNWVAKVEKRCDIPLSPADYYDCFGDALRRMSRFLYGNEEQCLLHPSGRDPRIDDEEAARQHFYSNFKLGARDGAPVIEYQLSQAFFVYSYQGLYKPNAGLQKPAESDSEFIRDCATNYLVKNFWHNYVHARAQRITDSNYHLFRHESRFYSDFEADNYANILLPLSYGCKVAADQSDLKDPRPDIANLFARNRCNQVFVLREDARKNFPAPGDSYDSLQDWEWLIRRRFTNMLAMRLIENNRTVNSITMHFFGELSAKRGKFTRPKTGGSIELNGVRITFENLGNIGALTGDEIRACTRDYVAQADIQYTTILRDDPSLKKYALDSLRAKCDLLTGKPSATFVVKAEQFKKTKSPK
jgi:hypothetical protein